MFNIICFITLMLLIWFKTDAFIVYSKLLRIEKWFCIDKWEDFKNTQDCSVGYHQYLKINNPDSFWIKLITCPICLSVWISLPAIIFFPYSYFIIVIGSLTIYFSILKLIQ